MTPTLYSAGGSQGETFVFVSYAHEDAGEVYEEIESLQRVGLSVYFDEGIHPGSAWHDELASAIERCSLFLIFVSARSAISHNVRRELTFALDRGKPVLAVHLHGFEAPAGIHLAIGDRQAIHRARLDEPEYRSRLLEAVQGHLAAPAAEAKGTVDGERLSRATALRRVRPRRRVERAVWFGALVAAVVGTFFWTRDTAVERPLDESAATLRFAIAPAKGTAFYAGYDQPLAVSPDGRRLVYVALNAANTKQLWLRAFAAEVALPIHGTDGASMPFWSPDSEWIGFFADNNLMKVRASGGPPQVVTQRVSFFGGAAWSKRGTIVFPTAPTSGLSRVSANGGVVSQLTQADDAHGRTGQLWPQFLDDGEHLVYLKIGRPNEIRLTSLTDASPRTLMTFPPGLISSLAHAPGHILFVQQGSLFARPFDEQRLEFTDEAVRLLDGVPISGPGRAPFTVSATGTLAYLPYAMGEPALLRWFERDGSASTAVDTPIQYVGFALSPDERQVVLSRTAQDGKANLWIRDLARGTDAPLTFAGVDFTPLWSPDGAHVAFGAARRGPPDVFMKRIDGTGDEEALTDAPVPEFPSSWSADGQLIVYVAIDATDRNDLWVLRLADRTQERLALNTEFNETHGKLSPDGRSIVYVTDKSGNDEVWVADFPAGLRRRQVSVGGGRWPSWGLDGDEIYYISDDRRMMASQFRYGAAELEVGVPEALMSLPDLVEMHRLVFPTSYAYAVASGRRFLVATRAHDPDAPLINVVVNWPQLMSKELR